MSKPEVLSSAFLTLKNKPTESGNYSPHTVDRIFSECFAGVSITQDLVDLHASSIYPVFSDFTRFARNLIEPMELVGEPTPEMVENRVVEYYGDWNTAFKEYIDLFLGLEKTLATEQLTDKGLVNEGRRADFALRKLNYQNVQGLLETENRE